MIGRYISGDPIGLFGGLNIFSYATGNPIRGTDFEGLTTSTYPNQPFPEIRIPNIPLPALPALPAWAAPLAVGGAALATGLAAGYYGVEAAAGCFMNEAADQDEAKKQAASRDYHLFCNTPPVPTGDPCLDALARQNWHQGCLDRRQAFADRWHSGTFDDKHWMQMVQRRAALAKATADVVLYCTGRTTN